ncbi:MAG TPA: helix-turn-helix transcriptional regulator [Allosphingosinicella sp.]|jgi:ribosome-binding protein aMBF1 (putative translation factor)
MASGASREKKSLTRLSAELERLAGELVRLGGAPPAPAAQAGERPSDRLRRRLHEARRARGMRQADLAERLGRPQSFVSNYERGTRRLEVSEFIQIARILALDAAAVVAELAAES